MTGSAPDPNQMIKNHRPQVEIHNGIDEASVLYQASQELAHANQIDDIREVVSHALRTARFPALLLTVQQEVDSEEEILIPYNPGEGGSVHPYFAGDLPVVLAGVKGLRMDPSILDMYASSTSEEFGKSFVDCLIMELENTDEVSSPLGEFARQWGFISAAFIPVAHIKHLDMLLLLGSTQEILTRDQVQAYIGLADLTRNAFERIYTMQVLEKRLTTLQSLNVISQAVALQADLIKLYGVIHNEVRQLLGEVTFFIAIYDAGSNMVEIPYLFEMGTDQVIQPPPFALGMGLTSLVIQKRQPIMLVEDTARRLQELGAQQAGLPAKSWMGVPMLVAGEVTGAIVIQDLFHEHRFDEDDLQMIVTMASQVAVTVRYMDLLKNARLQAERERALNEITAQIRASSDAQKILQTAAREVARVVGARRTRFDLSPVDDERIEEQI